MNEKNDNINIQNNINAPAKKKMKTWQKLLIAFGSIVLALVLAFVIFIISIVFKSGNSSKNSDINQAELTSSVYDQKIGWDDGEDNYIETSFDNRKAKLSKKSLAKIEAYIDSYKVDYKYSDDYNIDAALERWRKEENKQVTNHAYDVRIDGKLNADQLYKVVKENNQNFIENQEIHIHKEYSNKQLSDYCVKVVDVINSIHEKNSELDFDTVCCCLSELKILERPGSLDFAAVEPESKVLHFNDNSTENYGKITNNENLVEDILYHEMMHLFQLTCSCFETNGDFRIGITHKYDEFEVNPLSWYWLPEASAEMNSCEHLGITYGTYQNKISYVDTLNFILNLGQSDAAANIQDICFSRDLNEIFKMFDVTDDARMREFIKMMYSIEIIQQSPSGFMDLFGKKYGVDTINDDDKVIKLRLTVKGDALLSMTKLFYRNLARQLNKDNASLQDIYYLMRVFEADIDRHMANNIVGYLIYFKDFYPAYLEIQDEFLNLVAKDSGVSKDELKEEFNKYSMNAVVNDKKVSPNCTLEFLTPDKKTAVINFANDFYKKGYPSMQKANELCGEWLEKAPYEDIVLNN